MARFKESEEAITAELTVSEHQPARAPAPEDVGGHLVPEPPAARTAAATGASDSNPGWQPISEPTTPTSIERRTGGHR